jgi:hypothetical protein
MILLPAGQREEGASQPVRGDGRLMDDERFRELRRLALRIAVVRRPVASALAGMALLLIVPPLILAFGVSGAFDAVEGVIERRVRVAR